MFGNPETTAGGRALKFYNSVDLILEKLILLTELKIIGNRTRLR